MRKIRDAVIVESQRTGLAKSFRGSFNQTRPDDLAAVALRAVLERAGLAAARVDDVLLGCANQAGEDNRNVARMAALLAGLPQAPERFRPDRHPEAARARRDRVIERVQELGWIDAATAARARARKVEVPAAWPRRSEHAVRRALAEAPSGNAGVHRISIDGALQQRV